MVHFKKNEKNGKYVATMPYYCNLRYDIRVNDDVNMLMIEYKGGYKANSFTRAVGQPLPKDADSKTLRAFVDGEDLYLEVNVKE